MAAIDLAEVNRGGKKEIGRNVYQMLKAITDKMDTDGVGGGN